MQRKFKTILPLAFVAITLAGCVHANDIRASVAHPEAARFGSTVEDMTAIFQDACDRYDIRELDVAALPIAETSHVQVDCHGFSHAGRYRLAEFVFADDSLAFIWVLTAAEEESALLELLLAKYGKPTHDTLFLLLSQMIS